MKYVIFVLFFLVIQSANANWIIFYESQIFEAKLLLSSVQQDEQKTQALVALTYKEKLFSDGVGSQVIFLEHICGEINPTILEENFYEGKVNKSELMTIDNSSGKFKKYVNQAFPNLIKQICI
mgnify:FL=1|tara:strand:- start:784 stop:1152 length:369 start_codon:yes stop_codon:yes gene_type:complete